MLREVFRTVPLKYYQVGDGSQWGRDGIYGGNVLPWAETLGNYWGIAVLLNPLPTSPETIYAWTSMHTRAWPSFSFGYYRFNATTGQYIDRIKPSGGGQSLFISGGVTTSMKGDLWFASIYGNEIQKVIVGSTASTLVGDDPEKDDSWYYIEGDTVFVSKFHGKPDGDSNTFGNIAVDDAGDYFLMAHHRELDVYRWSSGEFVHTIRIPPGTVCALALEDVGRVYVLQDTRELYLLDYIRSEVLGVSRIPPTQGGGAYSLNAVMTYDRVYKRILIAEETANAEDGGSTNRIRGYRMVPEPIRLTTPIPLKAPRQRRTIPVLVQALGDINEGIGGYVLDAEVTGAASLVGFPVSDAMGNSILHIACEGSSSFSGEPDWSTTGSPEADPPHTGLVHISVSARVMGIPPADMPVSGVPGVPGGGGPEGPGGGGGEGLPETAPNMSFVVEDVYNSRSWRLEEIYEDEPDGRGAFTEAVVTALHDRDARWGHVDKNPGQNQYNGHAVDAINYKNDDGVTAEVFDIVTGGGDTAWIFKGRSEDAFSRWKYPA